MANKGPYLPNIEEFILAGLDPTTGLPVKLGAQPNKNSIKRVLRVVDECDAIHRYKYNHLPPEIDAETIERVVYYRGRGMLFYEKRTKKFYFLPLCLVGNIDVYGRYIKVTPLPFNGSATAEGTDKPWIAGMNFKVKYYIEDDEPLPDDCTGFCVILNDYCKQYSQTIIPRQSLNEPVLDLEAECLPYLRTAMLTSTGIKGLRVNGIDEQSNVVGANVSVKNAALNGEQFVPIIGALDFQELSDRGTGNIGDFLQAMQGIDNWRRSTMGYETNGVYEKNAHMLQDEQNMNAGGASTVMQDGLQLRQQFCEIANSIEWAPGVKLNISVEQDGSSVASFDTAEFDDSEQEVSEDDDNS